MSTNVLDPEHAVKTERGTVLQDPPVAQFLFSDTRFAAVWLVALGYALLAPKKYEATSTIVVDFKGTDPILGIMLPAQMMPGYLATQVEIIKSHKVAAFKDNPKFLVRSDKSGKEAAHKPAALKKV